MEIKRYEKAFFDNVFEIVHQTIEEIYPKYYPRPAVDFFHNHHSKEKMESQIPNEFTLLLSENNISIGTATLSKNEIKRFFILPEYQGKGYGKILLHELENKFDKNEYDEIILDSSLGAVEFYRKNDYVFKNYKTINLSAGNYLCYLEMVKNICGENIKINYDNKIFTSIENSKNGEVNGKTIFKYHQKNEVIWAEYYGGNIKKGFLVGIEKDNGELEFVYEHINNKNETRTGKCISTPKILTNGLIALTEKWEWTNGDKSKGESRIMEIK